MKYKGFTLIEVLIVIIIIGILATLLLPQIGGMAERARIAEAKSTLGAMRSALMVYYMENDTFPTAAAANIGAIELLLGDIIEEDQSLFAYSWGAELAPRTSIVVTALRSDGANTKGTAIAGGMISAVAMTVNADGSAGMTTSWTAKP